MQKILFADANSAFRASIRRRLRMAGYDVHEASNGTKAIGLLEGNEFSVVTIDMLMTNGNRLAVAEIQARWPEVKLIGTYESCLSQAAAGLSEHIKLNQIKLLEKPFSGQEFLNEIEALTKARHANSGSTPKFIASSKPAMAHDPKNAVL
jgi:DNA-binding NtrC family response regulator